MSIKEEKSKAISRRDFVKGSAAGMAAVTAGSMLVGCSPQVSETPTAEAESVSAAPSGPDILSYDAVTGKKWNFEIAPDPISESEITGTIEAEILVVGSGTAGLVTAASAVDNGAKVVLISASKGNVSRGGSNHALYSKIMKANEDKFPIPDTAEFLRKELSVAGYDVDQDKWWKFAKHSEEAMDWLIDIMEAAGYETVLENSYTDPSGALDMPVGSHCWVSDDMRTAGMGQQFVVDTLAERIKAAGSEIYYQTVAEQLEKDDSGRVTAVIAKGQDGTYTKYVGTKAVVLATGDFSKDKDMMARYCPAVFPLLNDVGDQGYNNAFKVGGLFNGDGHKMGLWVGAAWQRTYPNCPMIGGSVGPAPMTYCGHLGLMVNKNGYRYSNEDANDSFAGFAQRHQPDGLGFAIWGTNYAEASAPWDINTIRGSEPTPVAEVIESWDSKVTDGAFVKADTLEELIEALELPLDDTLATIEHYNELCEKGVDDDYHKRSELLVPIAQGPFYGAKGTGPAFLTVLGGLRTNLNMQVCDENDQPIPGLFNVGTMVGDFFANMYPFSVAGYNLGANCITFGYLTGKAIANDEI